MGAIGAQICKHFLMLLYKEFERIVINALAGSADLYCIVDACSVDGWVFVEKVT